MSQVTEIHSSWTVGGAEAVNWRDTGLEGQIHTESFRLTGNSHIVHPEGVWEFKETGFIWLGIRARISYSRQSKRMVTVLVELSKGGLPSFVGLHNSSLLRAPAVSQHECKSPGWSTSGNLFCVCFPSEDFIMNFFFFREVALRSYRL